MNNTTEEHQALPEEMLTKKQVSFTQLLFKLYLKDRFLYPSTYLNL